MTISKDLFLAILSMDSYNRGYGEGIAGLGGLGTQIGSATITMNSETVAATTDTAQTAGFYAFAYDVAGSGIAGLDGTARLAGKTVISYRGIAV